MRTRGAEALGVDHQRCGRGSVGRRGSAGVVGKVCTVAITLVTPCNSVMQEARGRAGGEHINHTRREHT